MPKLINRYGVVDAVAGTDGWIEYTGDANAIPMGAKVLLPLTEFREFSGTWQKHVGANGALGVKLSSADDPALIAHDLEKLALIAIEFPAFTDGRGTPPPRSCVSVIATSASCAQSAMCNATRSF